MFELIIKTPAMLDEERQKQERAARVAEAEKYLRDTDYMALRFAEDPSRPVPPDIAEARKAARKTIRENREG